MRVTRKTLTSGGAKFRVLSKTTRPKLTSQLPRVVRITKRYKP